jgi:hypothetical protein
LRFEPAQALGIAEMLRLFEEMTPSSPTITTPASKQRLHLYRV